MTPFQGFLVTLFRATPQRFARHVLACELLDSEAFVVVRPVSIAKSYRKFSVTCSWRAIMLSQGEIGDQIPLRNRIKKQVSRTRSLRVKNGLGMVGCIPDQKGVENWEDCSLENTGVVPV